MASWPRLVALACALLLAVLAVPASASASASAVERAVLAEINNYRAANGLAPVRYSRSLARSARRHSARILRVDRLHHGRRASVRYRLFGENLAWEYGNRRNAARVVQMWAASESHRRVMLNPRYTWGGAGRVYGRLGRRAGTIWTLRLGRK